MSQRRLTRQQRERIRHLQELRRQITPQTGATDQSGLGQPRSGLVIANFGPALAVEDPDGVLYRCTARQNLGTLVCGDRIVWQPAGSKEGVVVAVEPRRSLLTRPDYSGRRRPVAANLDQVAIVVAPRPELNEFLIDRYLVAVISMGIDPLLVVNKTDLLDAQARAALEERLSTYRRIGYPMLFISTRSGRGLDVLRARLRGCTSILVGQSGVGKSSLIQALLPDREIRTQALSEATGLGTHTTTTATLYHLADGGDLIDTPGVRSFEPAELRLEDLEHGFPELAPYLGYCRFSNCSHTVEPGCALLEAVEHGEIDPRRLQSYHQLRAALRE